MLKSAFKEQSDKKMKIKYILIETCRCNIKKIELFDIFHRF